MAGVFRPRLLPSRRPPALATFTVAAPAAPAPSLLFFRAAYRAQAVARFRPVYFRQGERRSTVRPSMLLFIPTKTPPPGATSLLLFRAAYRAQAVARDRRRRFQVAVRPALRFLGSAPTLVTPGTSSFTPLGYQVALIELETGVRIRDWVDQAIRCDALAGCDSTAIDCSGLAGLYTRTLDADMLCVTKVTEDGVALTEAASAAAVETTLATWYYDPGTHALRVHLASHDTAAANVVLIAVVLETLARGQTVTKARSAGTPLTWDGRVTALPSIGQRVTPDELGAGSVATLGELTIQNEDGRYERLFGERVFSGLEARVYLGRDTAGYDDLTLWLKAVMQEPHAGADRVTIPLLSLAAKLVQPAITDEFTTTAYPSMDPAITNFNIPRVWGTVFGAEAFRIASGRWKWANHAVTSIAAVKDVDGTTIATTGTDHALGEFTVDASHDTKARLYVDGRGYALDHPGALFIDVLTRLAGLTSVDYDGAALALLDEVRAVKVGFQVRTGSVREVLDLIAQSAFVDWFVDRTNVFSARARQRDQGNYVENDDFETDASGWEGVNGATTARTTSARFRGAAALEIVKPAAEPLAYARVTNLNLRAGTLYVVTMLAALVSGTTATCRVALTDSDGNEYFSKDMTLSSTRWTRITFTTAVPITNAVIFCDSETVTCDTEIYTCATEGGDLRVYPQYGGAGDVTIAIDDVEVVEAIVLDDTNAEFLGSTPVDPTLWRVRPGYQFDGRTQQRRFGNREDATTRDQFKTAESREIPGQLVDDTDAATVGAAALDYHKSGRTRAQLRLLDLDTVLNVAGAKVLYLNTSRRPTIPGEGRLFRLTAADEERPENGAPELRLEAEALHDAIFDQMTITAA